MNDSKKALVGLIAEWNLPRSRRENLGHVLALAAVDAASTIAALQGLCPVLGYPRGLAEDLGIDPEAIAQAALENKRAGHANPWGDALAAALTAAWL